MKKLTRIGSAALALMALVSLTACDKVAQTSKSVQTITEHAFNDTKNSWASFFTYHPPQPDPLPQTRYCYQMQSDIVCYDSEQHTQTSRLIGYQDGENISWVQPGGGSLGVSGGDAIALRPARPNPIVPSMTTASAQQPTPRVIEPLDTTPMIDTGPVVPSTVGQISVQKLPPTQVKTKK